jgi:2-keto-3-deoxy-L-rhamnonate aldolase RhmA
MFLNPLNQLQYKLRDGQVCLGLFHLTASALVSEALAQSPIDWLVYDMEASPADRMGALHFLQSLKGSSVTAVVRTRSLQHEHIEQVLDLGVGCIIFPKVTDRRTCEQVVNAINYPPTGRRGVNPVRASGYFGKVKEYFAGANDNKLAFVQIESKAAVTNIDEILLVSGIDGAFIGCGDLSMDMGCPGDMSNPVLLEAIARVLEACKKHGKYPGIFAYNLDLAQRFIADGFQFVAFGNDITMLQKSVTSDCELLRRPSDD